ncbi:putative ribonuclease H-like domain-containing protein [Tanacetum coccineum]
MSHPHPKRSFVPKAVLTRSGKLNTANTKAVNTARPVNTAASKQTVNHPRPINNTFKRGYSQSSRPFNIYFANKSSISKTNVNTVSVKHTTAKDRAVVRNKGKGANAVKASACWVWKAKNSSASTTFKKFSYIDARGRSKYMIGNKCYLDEYEDYDGGLVSFGDGKGRISGKGKIKTGTLDFEDVYFCKELKYNLFSVSQICDKKNNVLFTDTECLVLSSGFKLLDERNKTNGIAGTKDNTIAGQAQKEKEPEQEYILIPICTTDPSISQGPKDRERDTKVDENKASNRSRKDDEPTRSELERLNQREIHNENTNSTNSVNTISTPVSTARPTIDTVVPSPPFNTPRPSVNTANAFEEHLFKRFSPFKNDFSLLPVPNMSSKDNTGIFGNAYDDEDVEEDKEPKKVLQAMEDPSWVEEMQNELLQFKLLNDSAQGHTQEEGIDYDEVFAPVARIEAIRLFLAYASFKDFVVYQMDVKSAFLYGKIEEEVYGCQPPGFEGPHFPNKVYKVEKALYGLHQAPRAWYETLSTYLLDNVFHRGQIDKTLFIRRHKDDILLV